MELQIKFMEKPSGINTKKAREPALYYKDIQYTINLIFHFFYVLDLQSSVQMKKVEFTLFSGKENKGVLLNTD